MTLSSCRGHTLCVLFILAQFNIKMASQGRGLPRYEFEPQECKTPTATDNVTMVTLRAKDEREGTLTLRWKVCPGVVCRPIYRHGCSYLFSTPSLKRRPVGAVVHTTVDVCLDYKVLYTVPFTFHFSGSASEPSLPKRPRRSQSSVQPMEEVDEDDGLC